MFAKGAALIPSLAFPVFVDESRHRTRDRFVVVDVGWQFTLAEWIGGLVLVAIMTLLVKLTYPKAYSSKQHASTPNRMPKRAWITT